jgi:hypothetical protein
MAEGDLIKNVMPDAAPTEREDSGVVRRRAASTKSSGQRLRALPRARGDLDLLILRDPRMSFDDLLLSDDTRRMFAEVHLEHLREEVLVAHRRPSEANVPLHWAAGVWQIGDG